jgi:aminopeptidase
MSIRDEYARLAVEIGANVQKDQLVLVSADVTNREDALLVAEACYERGASDVKIRFLDRQAERLRLDRASETQLSTVPKDLKFTYDRLVEESGATIFLMGDEDPDYLEGVNQKRASLQLKAGRPASKRLWKEGIAQGKIQWCLIPAATEGWAKTVLGSKATTGDLWKVFYKILRLNARDSIKLWKEQDRALKARAAKLNKMAVKNLRFSSPGTDLVVTLSRRAQFAGGSHTARNRVCFWPNLPTEEVFTSPDYRGTNGTARVTRDFDVHGVRVSGLEVKFKNGVIVEFSAQRGNEAFAQYIKLDKGANRLGEVALVGIDSPIYQSGLLFREILLDENACCHIAIGNAYTEAIRGGQKLTSKIKKEIGFNESSAHTDMMISNDKTNVTAITYGGKEVQLLERGKWVI